MSSTFNIGHFETSYVQFVWVNFIFAFIDEAHFNHGLTDAWTHHSRVRKQDNNSQIHRLFRPNVKHWRTMMSFCVWNVFPPAHVFPGCEMNVCFRNSLWLVDRTVASTAVGPFCSRRRRLTRPDTTGNAGYNETVPCDLVRLLRFHDVTLPV